MVLGSKYLFVYITRYKAVYIAVIIIFYYVNNHHTIVHLSQAVYNLTEFSQNKIPQIMTNFLTTMDSKS